LTCLHFAAWEEREKTSCPCISVAQHLDPGHPISIWRRSLDVQGGSRTVRGNKPAQCLRKCSFVCVDGVLRRGARFQAGGCSAVNHPLFPASQPATSIHLCGTMHPVRRTDAVDSLPRGMIMVVSSWANRLLRKTFMLRSWVREKFLLVRLQASSAQLNPTFPCSVLS
jgi:hypothetical protein